jgi:hypothetical protein
MNDGIDTGPRLSITDRTVGLVAVASLAWLLGKAQGQQCANATPAEPVPVPEAPDPGPVSASPPSEWRSPAVLTIGFLLLAGAVFGLLTMGEGSSEVATSLEWDAWKATASLAVAIAAVVFGIGLATLWTAKKQGANQTATPRLAMPLGGEPVISAGRLFGYAVLAVAAIVGVFVFLNAASGRPNVEWPASLDVSLRTTVVATTVGLAAVPWLMVVWLLQRHILAQRPRRPISTEKLRELWDLLNTCILAFAVFVVLALVPTGALRVAYFAGPKDPDPKKQGGEFPATDVLLYGAFFAILLSAIALPLVVSYRAAAQRRLETVWPQFPQGAPTEEEQGERDRLEALLHLNVSFLRSPITALAVFTPLVTAALAAYLPGLK